MPRIAPLPEALTQQPFLVREALALGVTHDMLRGARFRRPFRGVRVPAHLPDSLDVRCRAAALLLPSEAAFSHTTAAHLHGLPLPPSAGWPGPGPRNGAITSGSVPLDASDRRRSVHDARTLVHATVAPSTPKRTRPEPVGIVCHITRLDDDEVLRRADALCITSVPRTWVDLATSLGLEDLVAVADAALRRSLVTLEQLEAAVAAWSRRPGVALLRKAVPLVEPATDSPMETRLRLLLVLAGLPGPVANRDVVVDGAWLARPDLSYPELRIAIEYDGDHHRVERRQWQSDISRRRLLEDAGWTVLVFTADDVLKFGHETVRRVRAAVAARSGR
jgi:very-short-patch-repair endonuclease